MKVETSTLIGTALDWAVAKCEGLNPNTDPEVRCKYVGYSGFAEANGFGYSIKHYSTDWAQGGPIIERENITLIRANSQYIKGKCVPLWFAETDKWVGHNITTGYEGEYFDPCFMIDEAGGCYGSTPLIAAMRAFVTKKFGAEIEIPEELK